MMKRIESAIRMSLLGAGCTREYAEENTKQLIKIIKSDCLIKKEIAKIAVHECLLLKDFANADNYVGGKIQKGKIELLDEMLNIKFNQVSTTYDELEKYSGIYQDDTENTLEIIHDTIGLVIKAPWIESKLIPVSDDSFIIENQFFTCDFQRDSSGLIESVGIRHLYFGGDYFLKRMKN